MKTHPSKRSLFLIVSQFFPVHIIIYHMPITPLSCWQFSPPLNCSRRNTLICTFHKSTYKFVCFMLFEQKVFYHRAYLHKSFPGDISLVSARTTLVYLPTSNASKSQEQGFALENKHDVQVTVLYLKKSCTVLWYLKLHFFHEAIIFCTYLFQLGVLYICIYKMQQAVYWEVSKGKLKLHFTACRELRVCYKE